MIYDELRDQEITKSSEFSLFLNFDGTDSTIEFGSRDSAKGKKNTEVYEYELISDDYWAVLLNDVSIGDLSFFTGVTDAAIIDSGTSLIVAPFDDYQWLIEAIVSIDERLQLDENTGIIFYPFDCAAVHEIQPSFWVQFDSYDEFEIPVTSLWTNELLENKKYCSLNVQKGNVDFYILGDVFMRNYYTTFSSSEQSVKF